MKSASFKPYEDLQIWCVIYTHIILKAAHSVNIKLIDSSDNIMVPAVSSYTHKIVKTNDSVNINLLAAVTRLWFLLPVAIPI